MRYLAKDHIKHSESVDFNVSGNYLINHCHNYWEFIYIADTVEHHINNLSQKLHTGDALIIRPNDNHFFSDSKKVISQSNFKITDELLKNYCNIIDKQLYDEMLYRKENILIVLSNTDNELLSNITKKLLFNEQSLTQNEYYSLCFMAIDIIIKSFQQQILLNFDYPQVVKDLIDRMQNPDNFDKSLLELTNDLPYSYMQITRIFKKELKITLTEYFFRAKMGYALNLLKNTNQSVLEISQITGYSTESHFCKVFHNYYGASPLTFKKK